MLCHELPRDPGAAEAIDRTYPWLADRLAQESGWRVILPTLRGAGGSAGEFSALGWLADLRFLVAHEAQQAVQVCAVGFGLGGALALRLAADEERVVGVGSLGAPADLAAWVGDASAFLQRCRDSGVVRSAGFPPDLSSWVDELVGLDPVQAAGSLAGRPLLIVHGTDDAEVPAQAARGLAEAAARSGSTVDLRVVPGAGHWLRADPRVVATLIGWLERHQ
ncbi:MAG TPA: alpha/beta fold hydrolase [Acidimicrobiales bacterium]|nr:alpha/beta fold hydrolase [Acidimicrobiales bacterium]